MRTASSDELGLQAQQVVRDAATELAGEVPELAEAMKRELLAHIPELGPGEEIAERVRSSCEGNLVSIMWMLREGVPSSQTEAPMEAVALARTMVREGGELTALLRAYRFGQAIFSTWWNAALGERVQDPRLLARALDSSLTFVFEFLDAVCMRLVQVFTEERERWLRSSAAVRAAMVDAILAGESVEPELASTRLGYELRRHHLGLVLWVEGGTGEHAFQHLEQAAGRVAAALGAARPLLVPAGPGQLWLWAGAFTPGEMDDLTALAEELTDVRLAAGRWSEGPEGFRTTHEEAQHARRVARLAAPEPAAVTCYDDVVIPSLLSADLERTRRFVAETLGPLGVEEDGMRRLRVTLQAFLGEGSSHVGAARRLHVHQNTVAYRVHRADELLGGRLSRDRLQIELALALADRLGDAVLRPGGG